MGLLLVPIFVGRIFNATSGEAAAVKAEYIFISLGIIAVVVAALLISSSKRHPELKLDAPANN